MTPPRLAWRAHVLGIYTLVGVLVFSLLASFSLPSSQAHAAACPDLSPGDLFKVEGISSIYLINAEGRRMYFPNSEVFHTYYYSFKTAPITTIAQVCVDQYPNAIHPAGLPFRAGSRLVTVAVSPKIYAVGFNGERYLISDANTAATLYGPHWNTLVRDVHDFHWSNYTEGPELVPGIPHDGLLIQREAGAAVYAVDNGYANEIVGTLPPFIQKDVRTLSDGVFFSIPNSGISVAADSVAKPFLLPNHGQPHIDGAYLSVTITQDGRPAQLEEGHVVRLYKKPFDLIVGSHEDSGVITHADIISTTLDATKNGTPMGQILSPGGGMAEYNLNPDKELYIKDSAYHYWFYQDELNHRYNRVYLDGTEAQGTRTVESFRFLFEEYDDIVVPVEEAGGSIYLSFYVADTDPDTYEWIEYQRGYLTIEWID